LFFIVFSIFGFYQSPPSLFAIVVDDCKSGGGKGMEKFGHDTSIYVSNACQ